MTASPSRTYQNDILGNRTGRDYKQTYSSYVRLYKWDQVNRLDATAGLSAGSGARYKYRADGMRVEKIADITLEWVEDPTEDDGSGHYDEIESENKPTTRYYYDGQMAMEEDFTRIVDENIQVDVTRYGIGARGIDMIAKDPYNASETKYYPIYDGHGNNVALITRNGNGFTCSNRRAYDAWGTVRQGSATGEPWQRYCANLGHVQDDESGLVYMRARYMEPWTGRFVSEDPARSGQSWFDYAGNDPINKVDSTGKWDAWSTTAYTLGIVTAMLAYDIMTMWSHGVNPVARIAKARFKQAMVLIMISIACFAFALGATVNASGLGNDMQNLLQLGELIMTAWAESMLLGMIRQMNVAKGLSRLSAIGHRAMGLWFAYALMCTAAILLIDSEV